MATEIWEDVEKLVQNHFKQEPDLTHVFARIEEGEYVPIVQLLEVNGQTVPSDELETFSFGPTDEFPFVTEITEITPEEFNDLSENGEWPLEDARKFDPPEAA